MIAFFFILLLVLFSCGPSDPALEADLAAAKSDSCTLTWSYSGQADTFRLYHAYVSGQYVDPILDAAVTTTTCDKVGIFADNQTHYFRVIAVYSGVEVQTSMSNEVSKFLRRRGKR